jgi:hypothetical protein
MFTVLCYFPLCYGIWWSGIKKIILNLLKCCVLMKSCQTLDQSNVNDMVLLRNSLSKRILRGQPIPLAARWVCGGFLPGIASSNPAGGMDICLLRFLRVVRQRSLLWTDESSRGVLLSVVCPTECDHETSVIKKPWLSRGCCAMKRILTHILLMWRIG